MAGKELVSKRTRRAFRELCTGTSLREIDGLWQDEGFAPGPPNDEVGERRSRYQSYLDAVDWTDPGHVARALRAFETTVQPIEAQYRQEPYDYLRRDGYVVANDGRISGGPTVAVRPEALGSLRDPAAIVEELARINRAVEAEDPAQVIGSAKQLVEATAKAVLTERGLPVNEKDDLPQLVSQAMRALDLHPKSAAPGPDGSQGVRSILGGATTVTQGIAEFRNGYGTGHGKVAPVAGLSARHAHLAVSGARLWCEFVLDTLNDPRAPWRRQTAPSAET